MNQQTSKASTGKFEGNMFLYSQPEMLTFEDHGDLGINTSTPQYDFVKNARVIPITAAELTAAQMHYPIVFSEITKPSLLAVVGVVDDVNLFVDENGEWDRSAYVPAYVRCHPFALASRADEQFSVVIDRSAAVITEHADEPFFDGKKLSPPIQARVDFCSQVHAHRQASQLFCNRIVELGLLSGQQATFDADNDGVEQTSGPYIAVDFDKFRELDGETLQQLHQDGALAALYAHRFSMDNWFRLLERRNSRRSAT